MKLIVCVDSDNGMLFNNRRQSKDKILIEYIYKLIDDKKLWINIFSEDLFEKGKYNLFELKDIESIENGEFIFIENISPKILEDRINEIIIFNWNRKYPADLYFDISLDNWNLESEEKIKGSSHDEIEIKIYRKEEK